MLAWFDRHAHAHPLCIVLVVLAAGAFLGAIVAAAVVGGCGGPPDVAACYPGARIG